MIYGSRYLAPVEVDSALFYAFGNRLITRMSNLFTGQNLDGNTIGIDRTGAVIHQVQRRGPIASDASLAVWDSRAKLATFGRVNSAQLVAADASPPEGRRLK